MNKKLIALCSFFAVVIVVIIVCGASSIGNGRQEIAETRRIEQERVKQQEWEDNAPIRAEAERLRIQKAKVWAQGQNFEAERKTRIAKYRREHNLPKKSSERAKNKNIVESWMTTMVANDCIRSINHELHEVTIDPAFWEFAPIDSKWQIMELVHVYFDGYATIMSSNSRRTLASYNAWSGVKIHD